MKSNILLALLLGGSLTMTSALRSMNMNLIESSCSTPSTQSSLSSKLGTSSSMSRSTRPRVCELKNGAQADRVIVVLTQLNVLYLLKDKCNPLGIKAIEELVLSYDTMEPVSAAAGKPLYDYGLVDAQYLPYSIFKDAIISMVEKRDSRTTIVSPVK